MRGKYKCNLALVFVVFKIGSYITFWSSVVRCGIFQISIGVLFSWLWFFSTHLVKIISYHLHSPDVWIVLDLSVLHKIKALSHCCNPYNFSPALYIHKDKDSRHVQRIHHTIYIHSRFSTVLILIWWRRLQNCAKASPP